MCIVFNVWRNKESGAQRLKKIQIFETLEQQNARYNKINRTISILIV